MNNEKIIVNDQELENDNCTEADKRKKKNISQNLKWIEAIVTTGCKVIETVVITGCKVIETFVITKENIDKVKNEKNEKEEN